MPALVAVGRADVRAVDHHHHLVDQDGSLLGRLCHSGLDLFGNMVRSVADRGVVGRELLAKFRPLGYTGCLASLQRLLNRWRGAHFAAEAGARWPLPDNRPLSMRLP